MSGNDVDIGTSDEVNTSDEENIPNLVKGLAKMLTSKEGAEIANMLADKLKGFLNVIEKLSEDERKQITDRIDGPVSETIGRIKNVLEDHVKKSVYQQYGLFFIAVIFVTCVLAFFGYKLYKSLVDRERKREEKHKLKQEKKKKK